jgi:hypothetical protein
MYVMIRSYPEPASKPDEMVRAGKGFATVLGRAEGFISCFVVREQNQRLLVVTLFDKQTDLQAAEQLSGSCLADHLESIEERLEFAEGEVVFQRGL